MGYQESYVWTDKQHFNELVKSFEDQDKYFAGPVEILTFVKNHKPFRKGQKVVYVTGERYPQSRWFELLIPKFRYQSKILFTEEVNPIGIWPDAGEVTDVIHEPFSKE